MISIRLSRKILLRILLFHVFVMSIGLLQQQLIHSFDHLLDAIVSRYIHHITIGRESDHNNTYKNPEQAFVSICLADAPRQNPHITRSSSQCNSEPEQETQHLRLHKHSILEIVMTPTKDETNPGVSQAKRGENDHEQYFNPAFIPLPTHFSLPQAGSQMTISPSYLLISRLVTEGLHQESHYCFASISTIVSEQRPERKQQMRCLTMPLPLDIPPTPANKCTGAWSSFPDIPGFHDPRVFWSGRGEPLIVVNSGSMYGCIGLWMVDLRALIPELSRALDGNEAFEGSRWRSVPLRYEYLTEITKNPRKSRNEVEKNWVLFFPNKAETVVVYEAMAKARIDEAHLDNSEYEVHDPGSSHSSIDVNLTVTETMQETRDHEAEDSTQTEQEAATKDIFYVSRNYTYLNKLLKHSTHALDEAKASRENQPTAKHASSDQIDIENDQERGSDIHLHARGKQINVKLSGGRTQALISSQGFTTPNLTHPLEPSCFDVASHAHNYDDTGNQGHWHQGSGSLRLVLCTRAQVRNGSCLRISNSSDTEPRYQNDRVRREAHSRMTFEQKLVQEGLVVHFSLVHRKFSNDWGLPMRYERYVVVWEARKPWRMVGVSKWPVVFNGEGVRMRTGQEPFRGAEIDEQRRLDTDHVSLKLFKQRNVDSSNAKSDGNDGGDVEYVTQASVPHTDDKAPTIDEVGHIEDDDLHLDEAYFIYSPSISWAWKFEDDIQLSPQTVASDTENLGTGYLDDEVLIGIGIDDKRQGFAKVKAEGLLQCLRLCPGVDG